jgi:hypothetical protein
MTAKKPEASNKPKVEKLDLSKETVQDLTESEAAAAAGGKPHSFPQDACQCKTEWRHATCGGSLCICRE